MLVRQMSDTPDSDVNAADTWLPGSATPTQCRMLASRKASPDSDRQVWVEATHRTVAAFGTGDFNVDSLAMDSRSLLSLRDPSPPLIS